MTLSWVTLFCVLIIPLFMGILVWRELREAEKRALKDKHSHEDDLA